MTEREINGYSHRKGAASRDVPKSANAAAARRGPPIMTTRTRRETITFAHPFRIAGVDHVLAAGAYEIVTDEEMIEGLSFASFRRVATMIMVPAAQRGSMEMIPIDPAHLERARRIDADTGA